MGTIKISTKDITKVAKDLRAGDNCLLTGIVYTARDAAHKRIVQMINDKKPLPFPLEGAVIYYSGPTPAKPGNTIGSCGPTTSYRMDAFTPTLLKLGLTAVIGKGGRSEEVRKSIMEYDGVYFCAIGGAGALAAKAIRKCEVIAFQDLGCESIKKLYVEDFPVVVAIDTEGNDIYKIARNKFRRN